MSDPILGKIDSYYSGKLEEFGPTPRGVDWNSEQSQRVRFDQMARLLPSDESFSLIDYGCGYGAFVDYLREHGLRAAYTGYDVSASMTHAAAKSHPQTAFTSDRANLEPADFVIASGIFSVKMDVETPAWERYIDETIESMDGLGRKGFAFNLLTAYSDRDRMRADLYYAEPTRYFERCMRYSRWVALLHDYGLYEFTLIVRKP